MEIKLANTEEQMKVMKREIEENEAKLKCIMEEIKEIYGFEKKYSQQKKNFALKKYMKNFLIFYSDDSINKDETFNSTTLCIDCK